MLIKMDFIDLSKKFQIDDSNSFISNSTEMPVDSWMDESDILAQRSEHESSNSNLESELKKAEIELLGELEKVELEEKQQKEEHEAKYKHLLEEVERLKHSELQKDAKISELTELSKSLKRNLCSLYKTAKFEIERKDSLLQEAHKELDKVLSQSRKVNIHVERECSHPCEASNLEKSCSKNSTSYTNKSETSITKENSCNRNSSMNMDKIQGNSLKENPRPKNSSSHINKSEASITKENSSNKNSSGYTDKIQGNNLKENPCSKNSISDKTSNSKYEKSHRRALSIERDSSSRRSYRNHSPTSEAKSSHRDIKSSYGSHYRHNSDSRKDTKHEDAEKRKARSFHHKSSTQPTHSNNDICSVQDKQRDLKCDERKPGHRKKDLCPDENSRYNIGKQIFQKDTSKSSQSHVNETAQNMTKCEIQEKSSEKLPLACTSRKHFSSRNASCSGDSTHNFEKGNFQKAMSESAQGFMNETSQKTAEFKCKIQEKNSEKLALSCTSRKRSSSRDASSVRDFRPNIEKHTFQEDMSESAKMLMNEIFQKTAKCEIQEKSCEKLKLAYASRNHTLSMNASVQTNEFELDGISRDLTQTNNLFYNILSDNLKDSFNKYEQKQISTLNKLKQSFVNYYNESQNRSKRPRTSFKFPCDFKNNLTCSEQFRSSLPET